VGILFRAPENVQRQYPQFEVVESYTELMSLIQRAMA